MNGPGNIKRICFVTGGRAEFGLMKTVLEAIQAHSRLGLQVVMTGMHLDPAHGRGVAGLEGVKASAVIPWPAGSSKSARANAVNCGRAMTELAQVFERLKTDVVLIVGDRVEALAAALAGHLSHRAVAHVHGGDRAIGQIDDSLRHAISKLSHVHFPATLQSAQRIIRLGEEPSRIHKVGSPGNDGIADQAVPWDRIADEFPGLRRRRFALVLLHPTSTQANAEKRRAEIVIRTTLSAGFEHAVIIHPNNDPGSAGILRAWKQWTDHDRVTVRADVPRALFLALMRDAAALVGNSSSGIIEAAAFGTPVLDIGPRQQGRQRSRNVIHCEYGEKTIAERLKTIWNGGRPRRMHCANVYGGDGAGKRIAGVLARLQINEKLLRKLITY